MEQTIVISTETPSVIGNHEAAIKVESSRGFVIMLNESDKICGIVYNIDYEDSYPWNGQTISDYYGANSLQEIMEYFKDYTFKLIS